MQTSLRIFVLTMGLFVTTWAIGCSDDDSGSVCGNGKVGIGEECDCGNDPDHLPPGCTAPNGTQDANCSGTCTRLTVETGTACVNGTDDDEDGLTDCDDPGCATYFQCLSEDCTNGIDDNGDGVTDCDDPECQGKTACQPEDCSNAVDDDQDGHTDCQDEECVSDDACADQEICWNGVDDNLDGTIDCDDPQCIDEPSCADEENPTNSNCSDGLDNDGDGWVDCADPGCFDQPPCDQSTCDNDAEVTLSQVGTYDHVSLDLTTDPNGGDLDEPCGAAASREKVIEITTGVTGRITVRYDQSGLHKFGLYFPAGTQAPCATAMNQCLFPQGNDEQSGLFDFGVRPAGTYYLIVAEAVTGEAGSVALTISLADPQGREICGNGSDDDHDGASDCGDLDCLGLEQCSGSGCSPDMDLGGMGVGDWLNSGTVDLRHEGADDNLSCLDFGADDMVLSFSITEDSTDAHLFVHYDQSMNDGGDAVLGLFFPGGDGTACDAAENRCADLLGRPVGRVDFGNLPMGTYFLIVKARTGFAGKIDLGLSFTPIGAEICDNGLDDNGDGAIDCTDTLCSQAENCVVEQCEPGSGDEDHDGLLDCADLDPDDMCQCSYACNPTGTCDGGQSGQTVHDPEIVFLGTCDPAHPGTPWQGTIDTENWYGAGQAARDDYTECPDLLTQIATPDVVLYFSVTREGGNIVFDYSHSELGVYHVAYLVSANQCEACDAGTVFTCYRADSESTVSGTWYFLDVQPGDYAFIVASDMDYQTNNPNFHLGPLTYSIQCQARQ